MTSQKIYGKALWLKIDGADEAADMQEATITFEEADIDDLTFGEVSDGIADKGKLKIKYIQSTAMGSFWRKVWTAAGTRVPFVFAVHGNEVPSEDEPHVTGEAFVNVRPDLGGAVGPKKSYTAELEWEATVDRALKTVA